MTKTYDPKCHDLAVHFMQDTAPESDAAYKVACDSLASHIQDAIEEWFALLEIVQQKHADALHPLKKRGN